LDFFIELVEALQFGVHHSLKKVSLSSGIP
jgi:hypothetical protein